MKRRLLSKLATALHKATDRMYPKPTVLGPDRGSPGTTLLWEEGPYEWSILATGKGNIWGEELTGSLTKAYNMPATLDFKHGWESGKYFVECHSGSTLVFGKN